jgi:hypothetical protein
VSFCQPAETQEVCEIDLLGMASPRKVPPWVYEVSCGATRGPSNFDVQSTRPVYGWKARMTAASRMACDPSATYSRLRINDAPNGDRGRRSKISCQPAEHPKHPGCALVFAETQEPASRRATPRSHPIPEFAVSDWVEFRSGLQLSASGSTRERQL